MLNNDATAEMISKDLECIRRNIYINRRNVLAPGAKNQNDIFDTLLDLQPKTNNAEEFLSVVDRENGLAMRTPVRGNARIIKTEPEEENGEYLESLRCFDCSVNFTSEHYLLGHLLHHIKQPSVLLRRIQPAPIKLTFKSKSDNNFEIINSPTSTAGFQLTPEYLADGQISTEPDNSELNTDEHTYDDNAEDNHEHENNENTEETPDENAEAEGSEDVANISFSPNYVADVADVAGNSPAISEESISNDNSPSVTSDNLIGDVPPTPPPESPSPTEYPKIRIKTTGLLKESLTITEITDDNPNGDYQPAEVVNISNSGDNNADSSNFWSTPCLEDPLKLPDGDRDDSNLLTSFLNNNNDQAKAFGITTDNEFISLDRLDDRNRNALQVYNPSTSGNTTNTLDSLTGLPMQQLAEQVSRLQPSGSGMHQQNVLINIQQFPQAPQQPHGYQHPPMYPPHPPHPGMPGQPPPMYQPYQYQPSPIYYPPAPGYPPAPHMQPPPPQIPQPQQMARPQQSMPPPPQPQYRQPMPPRPPAPRQFNQHPPRGPSPRQPMVPRQRAPMMRPRGGMVATAVRGPRPRMQGVNTGQGMNGVQNNLQGHGQQRMIKRTPEQIQSLQAKKKRMDVLVPDKNDDADCQVIAVQPKNTDGGLPQIQSVQGGTSDPTDNVMHLSDSITLSVRNPPPRTQSPKKSDAKVVANILATRGITVTATPKPKEKSSPSKEGSQAPSVAINLNSAVSIIPTAKNGSSNNKAASDSRLPTVDLTDDNAPDPPRNQQGKQAPTSPQKNNPRGAALPFRCDLCPAQYPTGAGLNKHRQSYHKTGSPCEIGIPLIDLKQPGILQKLTSIGIYNFIPLPSSTPNGNFALPVVSVNAARNSAVCNLNALGASSILTLGPVRSLPKSQMNNVPAAKQ